MVMVIRSRALRRFHTLIIDRLSGHGNERDTTSDVTNNATSDITNHARRRNPANESGGCIRLDGFVSPARDTEHNLIYLRVILRRLELNAAFAGEGRANAGPCE